MNISPPTTGLEKGGDHALLGEAVVLRPALGGLVCQLLAGEAAEAGPGPGPGVAQGAQRGELRGQGALAEAGGGGLHGAAGGAGDDLGAAAPHPVDGVVPRLARLPRLG